MLLNRRLYPFQGRFQNSLMNFGKVALARELEFYPLHNTQLCSGAILKILKLMNF